MDAVTNGLIAGVTGSILVVLPSVIFFVSRKEGEPLINTTTIFFWLVILSGLTIFQSWFTYIIVDAWTKTPQQTEGAVVI